MSERGTVEDGRSGPEIQELYVHRAVRQPAKASAAIKARSRGRAGLHAVTAARDNIGPLLIWSAKVATHSNRACYRMDQKNHRAVGGRSRNFGRKIVLMCLSGRQTVGVGVTERAVWHVGSDPIPSGARLGADNGTLPRLQPADTWSRERPHRHRTVAAAPVSTERVSDEPARWICQSVQPGSRRPP